MCDDDSFNVETVPRYAILGAQTGTNDGDNESTLGDRFFNLESLQTNTIAKDDLGHCISLHDRRKLVSSKVEQQFEQMSTVAVTNTAARIDGAKITAIDTVGSSVGNIHDDVPFELNRLAMFRPPSRTRLSGSRSNTVLREENTGHLSTCITELSHHENLGPNGYVDRGTTNHASKIPSNGPNQPAKTSRPSYPIQLRQRSLDKDGSRIQSIEIKQRTGSTKCQPTIKARAASAENRTYRPAIGLMRTNSSSIRKTPETVTQIQSRGPLRIRSASMNAAATRNIAAKAGNVVRTNQITTAQPQNQSNSITKTIVIAERVVSKPGVTRKSPYVGPETRARAKMKQNYQNLEVTKINSAVGTPKQSIIMKSVHARPLSQLNPNIARNAIENSTALVSNTKSTENGHVSRSRIRVAHEPIRIRNTQGRTKGTDGLPPIESESRFRQSLTRRPKGGDSLDRDVTKTTGKENGDEIWTVVAKKPEPVLEFASCLRSRVAAKKVQSTSTAHSTKPPKTGQSKHGESGVLRAPRRRTEAEREAFFRRLSTPKTVATIKK